ncbi:phenylalanine--tRNA ligase subunit alpha [Methanotorris formicicus]|nr:phenylalanine--tRNA ligase subunit alpha [Methanotorris formicicus]
MELHMDEKKLLKVFQETQKEIMDVDELSQYMEKEKIMRTALWLSGKKLVDIIENKESIAVLTEEGNRVLEKGLPERRIAKYLKENNLNSIPIKDLKNILDKDEINAALGNLKKKGIAKIEKGNIVFETLDYEDEEEILLAKIKENPHLNSYNEKERKIIENLKKRGFLKIDEEVERKIKLTEKGKEYIKNPIEIKEEITQLTREDIIGGRWREAYIRPYDVKIPVEEVYPAKMHPLTRIIKEIKEVLISMGFKEIKSPIVETEFWNFDVLFEPQDHPAREMQDTFFLKYPTEGDVPEDLLRKVKDIHEDGTINGLKISEGWKYKFDENVSKRTVLRTHTTASSIRYLASLSDEEKEKPHKVFCIGRVFRNEAIDYKHLPEFYQCEGIIMDDNVTFDNLIGILKEFLNRLGFEKVRFRPAYFPFTEPSLEAEVYLEGKGWLELLGAGMFRPEVLEPLGIKKPVLAWGIGFSRLAMLKLGLTDIRDLHKNDLDWLKRV